jgi:hypothetical protein
MILLETNDIYNITAAISGIKLRMTQYYWLFYKGYKSLNNIITAVIESKYKIILILFGDYNIITWVFVGVP